MPVVRVPTTPALDGDWPEEAEQMDLASAPDGPSGLFKTGVAGETDIDPSTKAEEAMEALADAVPPPSLVAKHPGLALKQPTVVGKKLVSPSPDDPSPPTGDQSQVLDPVSGADSLVPELRPRRRWLWAAALLAPAAGGLVGAMAWQRQKTPEPSALVAPVEAAPAPPRPAPPLVTIPLAPVVAVQSAEPAHPSKVQFSFHVMPKNALVRVDGKKVKDKIMLPWQEKMQHKVQITAPGFVPLDMATPATESRVFELRMEHVPPPQKKHDRPAPPSHDAAPVQEL
jgi:hypothetical protein